MRVRLHPAGPLHHPHQPRHEAVYRQPDRRPRPLHHHPRHRALQRSHHQKSVEQFIGKVLYLKYILSGAWTAYYKQILLQCWKKNKDI